MEQLDTEKQLQIDHLREYANEYWEKDKYKYFNLLIEAWKLYPEPTENWNEAYSLAKELFNAYLGDKLFDEAKKWLNEMIKNNNNLHLFDDDLWFNVGKYYYETGIYEEAYNKWKAVVKSAGYRYFEDEDPKYLDFYKKPQKYMKQ
jgi:tetratricopeptide (TPR) repeat protein